MNQHDSNVQRIMLLSHETGKEMGREEVLRKACEIAKYLRDQEKVNNADLNYALNYWREILESKHG